MHSDAASQGGGWWAVARLTASRRVRRLSRRSPTPWRSKIRGREGPQSRASPEARLFRVQRDEARPGNLSEVDHEVRVELPPTRRCVAVGAGCRVAWRVGLGGRRGADEHHHRALDEIWRRRRANWRDAGCGRAGGVEQGRDVPVVAARRASREGTRAQRAARWDSSSRPLVCYYLGRASALAGKTSPTAASGCGAGFGLRWCLSPDAAASPPGSFT